MLHTYIYTYVRTCIHTHLTYVHAYVHSTYVIHAYVSPHTHHAYVRTYIHTNTFYICAYIRTYTRTYIIHTYIRTYIRIYTHIHIPYNYDWFYLLRGGEYEGLRGAFWLYAIFCAPAHRTATYRVWRYQMLYNTIWLSNDEYNSARNM